MTPLVVDGKELAENSELIQDIKGNTQDLNTLLVNYIAKLRSFENNRSEMQEEAK